MSRFAAAVVMVLSLAGPVPAQQADAPARDPNQPADGPDWSGPGATAMLTASADVGVCNYPNKESTSNGQGVTTPLRQNQNWRGFCCRALLLNFDTGPIKGWTIRKAWLHLYVARGDLFGIGLTEVLAPWTEPRTVNFTTQSGGPSWLFARTPKDPARPAAADWWAWLGSDLSGVSWAHPSARYQFVGPAQIERARVGAPSDRPAPPGRDRFIHLKLAVEPDLVAALAAGTSYGLALTDDKGQVAESYSLIGSGYPYRENDAEDSYVFAREVQEPTLRPRLEVQGERRAAVPPPVPADVRVVRTEAGSGTLHLAFTAPGADGQDLIAYDVQTRPAGSADWTPLPRWALPRPVAAGARQVMPVWTLPPGQHELAIRGVSKSAVLGEPAVLTVTVPPVPPVDLGAAKGGDSVGSRLDMPGAGADPAKRDAPALAEAFTLCAVPDLVKVDPVSAAVLRSGNSYRQDDDYLRGNPVFTGQTVTLTAAGNEVVAFQLIVARKAGPLAGVKVDLSDLVGPDGRRIAARPNAQTYRLWYVRSLARPRRAAGPGQIEDRTIRPVAWHGDACLPLFAPFAPSFDLPAADNAIPDQANQAVWVDLFVPRDTPAGDYAGQVTVSAGDSSATLPLTVRVLPLALPDSPSWRVELNCYGGLDRFAGVNADDPNVAEAEHTFYRLAKSHRLMINALPYGQRGTVDKARVPVLSGEGAQVKVSDWSPWDKRLGPLLDGSAFTADKGYVGPGAGTPISHIYLPFHENWPLPVEKYYGDYADLADRLDFAEWAKKSRPLEQAYGPDFKAGYRAVARQFAEHFRQKGWTGTEFQFFLNNKYYYKVAYFREAGGRYGSSFWLLDEPVDRDDYAANAFFLGLAREGVESADLTPGPSAGGRSGSGEIRFAYRTDVSQPQMTRGLWNGVCDLWMLSWSAIHDGYVTTAAVRQQFIPTERFWHYGGGVSTSGAPVGLMGSFLTGWCSGSDGMLPYWTTLGGGDWARADDLAIYYTGRNYARGGRNYPGALPGLRMKVMRRCQQDIELLGMLSRAEGWDRPYVRRAVAAYADDPSAPVLTFWGLTPERADELRAAIVRTLTPKPADPAPRNSAPRSDPRR